MTIFLCKPLETFIYNYLDVPNGNHLAAGLYGEIESMI
ncbi:MAG: hypothetical protein [Olavius algarvensis Delta 4 endosymbiont]|nr:MAG: hypothetical protein [Olavius algarvensis Delta 4 endosymbiont]